MSQICLELRVAENDLEFLILLPLPPQMLRFQVCATTLGFCRAGD